MEDSTKDSRDSLPEEMIDKELSLDSIKTVDLPSVLGQASENTRDRFVREMHTASSVDDSEASSDDISRRMNLTLELIDELEHDGPAGLIHIAATSCALGRPIRIWNSNHEMNRVIGRDRTGEPLDVEYHQPKHGQSTGHWTLKDNVDPSEAYLVEPNGCLFAALAAQTENNPTVLRKETIKLLKRNIHKVAARIDELLWLKNNYEIALMLGGAKYDGRSEDDAAKILDKSQNAPCHQCGPTGHPRGHASHPSATGPTDSVENYSHQGRKSGFLSRVDQNMVGHMALSHSRAQQQMENLNRGMQSVKVEIPAADLPSNTRAGSLPQARWWFRGETISPSSNIRSVVLILRHHAGQQNNPNADVFVHTFYPVV